MSPAVATAPPLLDLPSARAQLRRISVDEYHRNIARGLIPDHCELLEGLVYQHMPKSPLHEHVAREVFTFLYEGLRDKPYLVRKEGPLTLGDSEPEPDVSVVSGTDPKEFVAAHPTSAELIVEVAVDAPELDRAKTGIYAEAGVPEYWIVLAKERSVEVYRRPIPKKRTYGEMIGYGIKDAVPTPGNLNFPVRSLFD